MRRDAILMPKDFHTSSFLSCEKDTETILYKLLIQSAPYSDNLKRLLVINAPDCLDNDCQEYKDAINMSIADLKSKGYILLVPKVALQDHAEVQSYIIISFDNFMEVSNPEFRDCTINFDIICHTDTWDLGNFRLRPLKIAGYIDGILNKTRLSGIGTLHFASCNELLLDQEWAGYTLSYVATHGSDDSIPND